MAGRFPHELAVAEIRGEIRVPEDPRIVNTLVEAVSAATTEDAERCISGMFYDE